MGTPNAHRSVIYRPIVIEGASVDRLRRYYTLEDVVRFTDACRKAGIPLDAMIKLEGQLRVEYEPPRPLPYKRYW